MSPHDTLDLSPIVAVLLAAGEGARLHELSRIEAKPALAVGGRRLVDFACAAAASAGVARLRVALPRPSATLARHLRDAWDDSFALTLHDGPPGPDTLATLRRLLEQDDAETLLVLPSDQVHALDLRALLAAHREGGAPATLASPAGAVGPAGPCVIARSVLGDIPGGDLWSDLLPHLASEGRLHLWSPPTGTFWRDIDTLDDLRRAAVDLRRGACLPLPQGVHAGPPLEEEGQDLALEVGGLRLSAPRFGARQRGRWTLLEDSLVLPGARIAPGARLSHVIVAPGAVVPANLTVGEDPAEDARWFRVTPGGTTLITAPMLARRAAERMHAQFGGRLPGLASPKA